MEMDVDTIDILVNKNELSLNEVLQAIRLAFPSAAMTAELWRFFKLWHLKESSDVASKAMAAANIFPVMNATRGGIDLNTSNGMRWIDDKGVNGGVKMGLQSKELGLLIARVKRDGVDSLSPYVIRGTPITSIWSLVDLQAPVK